MKHLFNKYRLLVVNTASEAELYLWDNWKHLFPLVDMLVSLSPAKAFMRSRQAIEHKNKLLGFGRMSWSLENTEKWAQNGSAGSGARFLDTEIWAPDWNQVDKTGVFPDIYIRLYNAPDSHITREGLIIAIKKSISDKRTQAIEPVFAGISGRVPDSTVTSITRSWWPGSGFGNQIQDMNKFELEAIVTRNMKPSLVDRIRSILKNEKLKA